MKPPVCRTCGKAVVNGNLFCSKPCGQAPKAAHEQLEQQGFVRSDDFPNVYTRDGVAVTVEQVNHLGIDVAMRHHRTAVEGMQ